MFKEGCLPQTKAFAKLILQICSQLTKYQLPHHKKKYPLEVQEPGKLGSQLQ